MSDRYNAVCTAREELNPALCILRVKADDGPIAFRAGQYATLGLLSREPRRGGAAPDPKEREGDFLIRRPYSIASSPDVTEYLEFVVTYVPEGEESPRLFELEIGDRLYLAPSVKGRFTFDLAPRTRDVVLIATGTGIAPFMSYIRTHFDPDEARRWVVLHGARFSWDLAYRSELEMIDRLGPTFTYIPSITRPVEDPFFTGPVGRIPNLLEEGIVESCSDLSLDPARVDVFLCGNPDMIGAVTRWLETLGFVDDKPREPGTIHTEKYW